MNIITIYKKFPTDLDCIKHLAKLSLKILKQALKFTQMNIILISTFANFGIIKQLITAWNMLQKMEYIQTR